MIINVIYVGKSPDLIINGWYRVRQHYIEHLCYVYEYTVEHNGRFIAVLPKNDFLTLGEFRDRQIDDILS